MFYINYFLISFSILGYGIVFIKLLGLKTRNFGFIGFYGLSLLTFLSYITAPFFVHNFEFNICILILGLLFFFLILKEKINFKKNIIVHLIIFSILIIFISAAKTHDDFPYYHFPYSYLLTQIEHPIGLGHVNPGFRNASSLFFLNSLFYLPETEMYLMHIYSVFFLGFANTIFVNFVFNQKNFKEFKFVNFLALISISFLNTFFYRMAEHGVDRSGMVIVFIIAIISILILKNINSEKLYKENLDLFFFISILLALLASTKSIYLLYIPLGLVFLFLWRKKFFVIIKSYAILYSITFVSIYFLYNFINSGCIVYPADFICYYDLSWSLPRQLILDDYVFFEVWSKAGASPGYLNSVSYKLLNQELYISGLNWFSNWINNYFFNKVSDYLLGLLFLLTIFYIVFYKSFKGKKNNNNFYYKNFLFLYFFFIIIFLEWFFRHPQLRYGGYHLIALLIFLPLSFYFNNFKINYSVFFKKAKLIIIFTLIIYAGRNIDRLIAENKQYDFNPLVSQKFYHDDQIFKYMEWINKSTENEKFFTIKFLGKNFLVTVPN